ncbi:hypothetical protein L0Z24_18600 [Burkholderia multivorans]|uniref:hypothetical protein n=1 Tax=Burkholderia multivorans TaxID=87883 RepID=UPI00201AB96E|nr:hypothetical protein [Burkholderia multivorans]MCL4657415.1 hypothetical protein [Burkholderia multivorans]
MERFENSRSRPSVRGGGLREYKSSSVASGTRHVPIPSSSIRGGVAGRRGGLCSAIRSTHSFFRVLLKKQSEATVNAVMRKNPIVCGLVFALTRTRPPHQKIDRPGYVVNHSNANVRALRIYQLAM